MERGTHFDDAMSDGEDEDWVEPEDGEEEDEDYEEESDADEDSAEDGDEDESEEEDGADEDEEAAGNEAEGVGRQRSPASSAGGDDALARDDDWHGADHGVDDENSARTRATKREERERAVIRRKGMGARTTKTKTRSTTSRILLRNFG